MFILCRIGQTSIKEGLVLGIPIGEIPTKCGTAAGFPRSPFFNHHFRKYAIKVPNRGKLLLFPEEKIPELLKQIEEQRTLIEYYTNHDEWIKLRTLTNSYYVNGQILDEMVVKGIMVEENYVRFLRFAIPKSHESEYQYFLKKDMLPEFEYLAKDTIVAKLETENIRINDYKISEAGLMHLVKEHSVSEISSDNRMVFYSYNEVKSAAINHLKDYLTLDEIVKEYEITLNFFDSQFFQENYTYLLKERFNGFKLARMIHREDVEKLAVEFKKIKDESKIVVNKNSENSILEDKNFIEECYVIQKFYLTKEIIQEMIEEKELIENKDFTRLVKLSYGSKDYEPIDRSYRYFFNKSSLSKFKIFSVGEIVKKLKSDGLHLKHRKVKTVILRAKIAAYHYSHSFCSDTAFYKYEDVKSAIIKEIDKASTTDQLIHDNKIERFDLIELFTPEQQRQINDYLEFRECGRQVEFKEYSSLCVTDPVQIKKQRNMIISFFFRVYSNRQGFELSSLNLKRHKALQEIQSFQSVFDTKEFNFTDITIDDVVALSKQVETTTISDYVRKIRPFLYYLLNQEMKNEVMCVGATNEQYLRLGIFTLKELRIREIFSFIFDLERKRERSLSSKDRRNKSRLTRSQMLQVRDLLAQNPFGHNNLRDVTMWMTVCGTGIRPLELIKLRLEHFDLDSNYLIRYSTYGEFAILHMPAVITKQERTPTHKECGLFIPKAVVEQLNTYITYVYKHQPPHFKKGTGYLFKPNILNQNQPYIHCPKIIEPIRHMLDFLTDEQRKDFVLKYGRHSMAELIEKTRLEHMVLLPGMQDRAAEYQMRHLSERNRSRTKNSYTSDLTPVQFYAILNETLNFPWTFDELHEWEATRNYEDIHHGESLEDYFVKPIKEVEVELQKPTPKVAENNRISETELKTLKLELEQVQEEIKGINTRKIKLPVSERVERINALTKREKQLQIKIG